MLQGKVALVTGAGSESAPTTDDLVEGWQRVIEVNLSGVFYGMKHQIAQMLNDGGGAIVNVASILGQVGFANAPVAELVLWLNSPHASFVSGAYCPVDGGYLAR